MKIKFDLKSPTNKLLFLIIFTFIIIFIRAKVNIINANEPENYQGVSYCVECHPSESAEWGGSPHSKSYNSIKFQEDWALLGSPESCVSCHVTGYNEDTESFALPEITCEECHGPGDSMIRDTSVELCGECHSGPYPTYEDWIDSSHPDWEWLVENSLPGGQSTVSFIFGMTRDINHMFIHTNVWMQYPGDALHYERQ